MSVSVWRIATEGADYHASDLSGTGAKLSGGRWNSQGTAVVYASGSIALAVLESVGQISTGELPYNRYLVRIDVPSAVWKVRTVLEPRDGWDAVPAGMTSITQGDAWLASVTSALLVVPSVIVPEEDNVLINPQHPQATLITAKTVRRWMYDPRI